MDLESNGIVTLSMINNETGEITNLGEYKLLSLEVDTIEATNFRHSIPIQSSVEFTLENTCINTELVDELFKKNGGCPCKMTVNIETLIQNRRHKKKRINKKWSKIYGYYTIIAPITSEILFTDSAISRDGIINFEIYINEEEVKKIAKLRNNNMTR